MITTSRHLKHYIFLCNPTKSPLPIPQFSIIQSRLHICYVSFPLPFFTIIRNFIGKCQFPATQASLDKEEVTDEILNQILTSVGNASRPNTKICTAYVDKFCRAGNLSAAARLLQSLHHKHIFLSPKAYNLLLRAASEKHDIDLLCQVFKDLLISNGVLSSMCYADVAKAFTKTNDGVQLLRFIKKVLALTSPSATVVDKALLIYDQFKSLSCKLDLFTYNTILDILGHSGRTDEMLHEFASMKEAGIALDIVSYNTLLNNVKKVRRLDLCLVYFREMGDNVIEPDLLTYTTLIESFGRSGDIEESIRLFNEMKMRQIRPSIYFYRSLVSQLKKMGKVDLALKYLEELNSSHSDLAGPNDFKRKKR
ncbi:hypothetical protein ACJW31_10G090900 [Castanea mollissima]